MRPSDLFWSQERNFPRSKVHFPDLEVCCDWSVFCLILPTVSQGFSSVYCRLSDYLGFTFRFIPLNIISLSITVEPRLSGLFDYQDFYMFPWSRFFHEY